jgi:hypothetical protein
MHHVPERLHPISIAEMPETPDADDLELEIHIRTDSDSKVGAIVARVAIVRRCLAFGPNQEYR